MRGYELFLTDMLEKVFPARRPRALPDGCRMPVFPGTIPAAQLVYTRRKETRAALSEQPLAVTVSGAPVAAVLRSVELVPADFPAYEAADERYITTEPGLFPDLLLPLPENKLYPVPGQYRAVWIDFPGIDGAMEGTYNVTVSVTGEAVRRDLRFSMTVLPAALKPQTLIHTEWFHADCLALYYRVPMLSEEHWRIIEAFIQPMASVYGINTLLTPVFTPPIDTSVGGERPTMQLVNITITGGGGGLYTFDFSLLERWCALCKKHGIQYVEIAHFFTQWGAAAAPKIIAVENGVQKRIFGWDTPANSPEYRRFLEQFIPPLRATLAKCGYDERHVFFHVSDEPSAASVKDYAAAKAQIADLVAGSVIIDAVSDIAFYRNGIVEHPVVANNHIMPFIEAGVPGLWTYHCCAQYERVPNRFFAMPSERNRVLGILMYRYNIQGFLQWGYNFYYSRYSRSLIDPYYDTGASRSFPAGDPYLVYPGGAGKPLSSIRGEVIRQAIEDMRILCLIEERHGRQTALDLLHERFPSEITFERYPCDAEYFFHFRERAAEILCGTQITDPVRGRNHCMEEVV